MKTPRSVEIEITTRCNLRCAYCSHFSSAGDVEQDLPADEWLRFFKELNTLGILNVSLSGGEPFFREDLKGIIEGIVSNRMRYTILSNGTIVTGDMANFIFTTGRCDGIQISIDGSSPEIHDQLRGKGTFKKAVNSIRLLQQHKVPIQIRVTVHKHNVSDLGNIAKLLLNDLSLPGFSTNSASHLGLCRMQNENIQLSIQDRMTAMNTLLNLSERYPGRITATAGPLAEARQWMNMNKARRENREPFPNGGYLSGCNKIWKKINISADGTMITCIQMGHVKLGQINRDRLVEIWQGHPELRKMRERRHIPLSGFVQCRACEYIDYCTGGCPALAYSMKGSIDLPAPDSCLKQFLEAGGTVPDRELATVNKH
ncbi:SynChlorMet cassette radical SAM/SPASM protein ScmE [Fibrobacterota bacterium]